MRSLACAGGSWTSCSAQTPASSAAASSWPWSTSTGGHRSTSPGSRPMGLGCRGAGMGGWSGLGWQGRTDWAGQGWDGEGLMGLIGWIYPPSSAGAHSVHHSPRPRTSTGMGGPLADDEFNVILGALDMTSKTAASNMTREWGRRSGGRALAEVQQACGGVPQGMTECSCAAPQPCPPAHPHPPPHPAPSSPGQALHALHRRIPGQVHPASAFDGLVQGEPPIPLPVIPKSDHGLAPH
jgi:hypothetical protein